MNLVSDPLEPKLIFNHVILLDVLIKLYCSFLVLFGIDEEFVIQRSFIFFILFVSLFLQWLTYSRNDPLVGLVVTTDMPETIIDFHVLVFG